MYLIYISVISKRCHNKHCERWSHQQLELDSISKTRDRCPGYADCKHIPQCLRPGRLYECDVHPNLHIATAIAAQKTLAGKAKARALLSYSGH